MKIKNLKIFKSIIEKRENMRLERKNEIVSMIKKDWTNADLERAKAQYIYGMALYPYRYEDYIYNKDSMAMSRYLTEDVLKRYLLNTNTKYFTKEEIEFLMKEIEVQTSKKLIK